MPTGIGTAIAAGAMSTGAAALGFSAVIGGSLMTHFLVTTAIGAAINALTPKPTFNGAAAASSGYTVTTTSSTADHQIIYGKTKVAGVRVFDTTTGEENKYLHRVLAFAGHEVESFEQIWFNDQTVTIDSNGNVISPSRYNGLVRINVHYGTDDQLADSDLVSEVGQWTSNHRLRGIAYIYVRFKFDQDAFPNGVPEITAVIKGKKVYDPRTDTTAWSDNPALCIRDYLLNTRYGLGESLDNLDNNSFVTAADVCDYYNYPLETGDKRYTLNGSFVTSADPYSFLNAALSSIGGLLWYAQGKWRIKPAYWTEPVALFTEDDLRSSISVATRHSRRDNFNTVNGVWKGEDTNWQTTDFPPVTNQDFINADNGQEKSTDLSLGFTTDLNMARRIANIYLERNRQQLTVMASFGMRAFQVQVGDNVRISNARFGWIQKEFEVVSWTFGLVDNNDLQVHMTLREITQSVFDDIADGAVYERDNTTLQSPFDVPIPSLDAASAITSVNEDGTTIPEIGFSWSVTDPTIVDYYNFEWKLSGAFTWNSLSLEGTEFLLSPAISNAAYDYRVQAVNHLGVRSAYASAPSPVSTGNDATTPNAPSGISAAGGYGSATVTWIAPTQNTDSSALKDLFQYKVYRGTSASPTTLVGRVSGEIFTDSGLLDSTTYYYRVKAIDFTGNESDYSADASATTNPELVDGANGASVLVVYAEDAAGTNQSLTAGTRQYVQYVEYTTTAPSLPVSGTFVKFVGEDGTTGQGIYPIYADDASGSNQSFDPTGKTYVTFYESTTAPTLPVSGQTFVKYVGDNGDTGAAGERGPGQWHIGVATLPTTSSGAHTDFTNALFDPVDNDQAWFYTGTLANPTAQSVWIYEEGSGATPADSWNYQENVIVGDLIVDGTITGDKVAASSVITSSAQIDDAIITSAKIADAEITTANIADAAITTAKISDASVDTLQVAGNAISAISAATANNTVSSQITVPSVASSQPVQILATFARNGTFTAQHVITRNGTSIKAVFLSDSSGAIVVIDTPGAGTHTYQYSQSNTGVTAELSVALQLIKR